MSVSHDQLPRDENGIVQGAWRILHDDPTFHGTVGVYELHEGEGTAPAFGRALLCAIGEYGSRLYLEPWGELPVGFDLTELIAPTVHAEALATLERCPWRLVPLDDGDTRDLTEDTETLEKLLAEGKLEPADDAAKAALKEPAAPAKPAAPEPDAYDAMDLEALRKLAAERGLEGSERRQEPRIRRDLRADDAAKAAS